MPTNYQEISDRNDRVKLYFLYQFLLTSKDNNNVLNKKGRFYEYQYMRNIFDKHPF